MRYLLDTGIILRLTNRNAANHLVVRQSVTALKRQGHTVLTTFQNLSEFWNVCTRPVEAHDGLGLTDEQTHRRLRTIERITSLLPDSPDITPQWKSLLLKHRVRGVQVHDAKIAALMMIHQVSDLLTLNPKDFSRYSEIRAITPEIVLADAS